MEGVQNVRWRAEDEACQFSRCRAGDRTAKGKLTMPQMVHVLKMRFVIGSAHLTSLDACGAELSSLSLANWL